MSCKSGSCGNQKSGRRGTQHAKERVAAVTAKNRDRAQKNRENFARLEEIRMQRAAQEYHPTHCADEVDDGQ